MVGPTCNSHSQETSALGCNYALVSAQLGLRQQMECWHQTLVCQAAQLDVNSLMTGQDGRRYLVLLAACRNHDLFYMAIHQLCCLWSIDRSTVHRLLEPVGALDAIDSAFEELQNILNNDNLTFAHLCWFANFPWPSQTILDVFPKDAMIVSIVEFLDHFSLSWPRLLQESEYQGQPVLASELENNLLCPSAMLRYIFFTISCIRLDIGTEPTELALDDNFDTCQNEEFLGGMGEVRKDIATEYFNLYHR
ncbi:MIZ/SP-RING zinc finger protein [Fusarium oxysporum f. sp. phaseoli]